LTLDETDVAGNAGKKAAFASSTSGNAYLSQEFGEPQTGQFSVEWDIYVDNIMTVSPYRAGMVLVGDDTFAGNGPNADNSERFVYLGFYKSGGGDSGTMSLVARDRDDGWTAFSTVATGLDLDRWYTIRVDLDLDADTYDVYVDGEYQATVSSRIAKSQVTHISFAQWNDGAGAFYVDNVREYVPPVCTDADNDTYAVEGGLCGLMDCDDSDASINPGALEICGDGLDNDCSGAIDDADLDGDSYISAFCGGDDCDDSNAAINPGATEINGNGVDEDCDGLDGVTVLCYADADQDGYGTGSSFSVADGSCDTAQGESAVDGDCDDADASVHPGAVEVVGDGVDQDCDSQELCYLDGDDDGFRPDAVSTLLSADLDCLDAGEASGSDPATDCDDSNAAINPGALEICGNGVDEDCDGTDAACPALLTDETFDASTSEDIRTDDPGQDWYESRQDTANNGPSYLSVDETDVAGNDGKKALLTGSLSANTYLTQEFSSPQTGTFSAQWDVYVDEVLNRPSGEDRSTFMTIGDDADGIKGPCSTGGDRFVYLSVVKDGGGTTGTANLVHKNSAGSSTIIGALSLDQWYTFKVDMDLASDTYDIYVYDQEDTLVLSKANIAAATTKTALTHISFATWNDGPSTFYVDNVYSPALA
ncbi:putative metal-binding motif-containing protein, partial [Candidatus Woesearchaeota archaeon]|nr:putative metal-binding motif-containing protein [Candidatus Woesearchaeota archaeon]